MALTEVDWKTVDVAIVTAVAKPDGKITSIGFWDGSNWIFTGALALSVGQSTQIKVVGQNTTTWDQKMGVYVKWMIETTTVKEFVSETGATGAVVVKPGNTQGWVTDPILLDKPGTYNAYVELRVYTS